MDGAGEHRGPATAPSHPAATGVAAASGLGNAGANGPAGRALVAFAATAALALGLDILTKSLVVVHLTGSPPVKLLGGLAYLDLTRNGGAAFSLGTGYTWVFGLVTIAVIGWIGWLLRRLRSAAWGVALGLVLGGALGNLADRIFRAPGFMVGHVVDFVSVFGPDAQYFPIFNAADASLSIGVVLLLLLELTGRRRDGSRVRPTGSREPQ